MLLAKVKNKKEATFYIQKTIENSWSRVILDHQISLDLYHRSGKLIANFDTTIENNDIEFVKNPFKENYILDFLQLSESSKEKDLEAALVKNISEFLMEMGKGFAFIGKQYKVTVGGQEFFIDLMFYNYRLKRFVVIELKTTEFKPEYIGKLGFYVTAIDRDVKMETDKATIGLLICKTKNDTVVEYALNNNQPTGIAEYKMFSELPSDIASCLPSDKDIQEILEFNSK